MQFSFYCFESNTVISTESSCQTNVRDAKFQFECLASRKENKNLIAQRVTPYDFATDIVSAESPTPGMESESLPEAAETHGSALQPSTAAREFVGL